MNRYKEQKISDRITIKASTSAGIAMLASLFDDAPKTGCVIEDNSIDIINKKVNHGIFKIRTTATSTDDLF